MTKKIYIAGPMRGYPHFNFPAFFDAQTALRRLGWETFNPAERDNETHGVDISADNATGSEAEAASNYGFSLREALGADMAWICAEADAIYMLRGWSKSSGARAEKATAEALGLDVHYQSGDIETTPDFEEGYAEGWDAGRMFNARVPRP